MSITLLLGLIGGVSLIMLASLAGILLLFTMTKNRLMRAMPYLIASSAGLFVYVCYHLAVETLHFLPPALGILWIIAGFFAFMIFTLILPDGHHHIDDDEKHNHSGMAKRILAGDAIHNIGDGILLVPAFLVDIRLGIVTAIGVFLHEFIQEISEFILLKESGYSTRKALFTNFLVSSTVIVGVIIASLSAQSMELVGPFLGLSAGAFAFLVVYDLFPRIFKSSKTNSLPLLIVAFVLGIGIMIGIGELSGHSHEAHDHEHADESHEHEEDHGDELEHAYSHEDENHSEDEHADTEDDHDHE